jgi:hypothetical protein
MHVLSSFQEHEWHACPQRIIVSAALALFHFCRFAAHTNDMRPGIFYFALLHAQVRLEHGPKMPLGTWLSRASFLRLRLAPGAPLYDSFSGTRPQAEKIIGLHAVKSGVSKSAKNASASCGDRRPASTVRSRKR